MSLVEAKPAPPTAPGTPLVYAAVRPVVLFIGLVAVLVGGGFLYLFVGGIVHWVTRGIPEDANVNPLVFLLLALGGGLAPLAVGLLFLFGRVSVVIDPAQRRVTRTLRWLGHRRDRIVPLEEFQAVGVGVASGRHGSYHFARLVGVTTLSIPGDGSRAGAAATAAEVGRATGLPVDDEPQRVGFGPLLG